MLYAIHTDTAHFIATLRVCTLQTCMLIFDHK